MIRESINSFTALSPKNWTQANSVDPDPVLMLLISMMDGWRDGKIMLLSHTLTMRESHTASLGKFHPVV